MTSRLIRLGLCLMESMSSLTMPTICLTLAIFLTALPKLSVAGEDRTEQLARKAHGFLRKYCGKCHHDELQVDNLDVLDRSSLVHAAGKEKPRYVDRHAPLKSLIWRRVSLDKDMPPSSETLRPSVEDIRILKEWLQAGAPFPKETRRAFVTEKTILGLIRDDLRHVRAKRPGDEAYKRYFSLANLHNADPTRVPAADLPYFRAAVSKAVNSMSWKKQIAVPTVVDAKGHQILLRIDLRDYGWDERGLWQKVLRYYPYGLHFQNVRNDRESQSIAQDIERLSGHKLAHLRADWFVAMATRPPLYHELLRLPRNAKQLEVKLGVNVRRDFKKGRLRRAGVTKSGVSTQHRMMDRHDALFGAYWISHDLKPKANGGNLLRLPLGPPFEGNPFNRLAFQHDGGEIIFNLPNGLQGYLLVDAKGRRIDEGPTDVVSDSLKSGGSAAVVNGISCMACHNRGIKRFTDAVRDGTVVGGDALQKVQDVFPTNKAFDQILQLDEQRFLSAVEKATGSFLKTGAKAKTPIKNFAEPIGKLARLYVRNLTISEVAVELGLPDADALRKRVGDARLKALGLGVLLNGRTIQRVDWDARLKLPSAFSLFHRLAREAEFGTPVIKY